MYLLAKPYANIVYKNKTLISNNCKCITISVSCVPTLINCRNIQDTSKLNNQANKLMRAIKIHCTFISKLSQCYSCFIVKYF